MCEPVTAGMIYVGVTLALAAANNHAAQEIERARSPSPPPKEEKQYKEVIVTTKANGK